MGLPCLYGVAGMTVTPYCGIFPSGMGIMTEKGDALFKSLDTSHIEGL